MVYLPIPQKIDRHVKENAKVYVGDGLWVPYGVNILGNSVNFPGRFEAHITTKAPSWTFEQKEKVDRLLLTKWLVDEDLLEWWIKAQFGGLPNRFIAQPWLIFLEIPFLVFLIKGIVMKRRTDIEHILRKEYVNRRMRNVQEGKEPGWNIQLPFGWSQWHEVLDCSKWLARVEQLIAEEIQNKND